MDHTKKQLPWKNKHMPKKSRSRQHARTRSRRRSIGGRIMPSEGQSSEYDYDSKNGFSPKVWGPGTWLLLMTMGRNYPVHPSSVDRRNYFQFIDRLKYVLPCGDCRRNLQQNLIDLKFTGPNCRHMQTRSSFSRFINSLHNMVNLMLGKPTWNYERHRDFIELFRASGCDNKDNGTHVGCDGPRKPGKVKTRCVLHMVPRSETDDRTSSSIVIHPRCM